MQNVPEPKAVLEDLSRLVPVIYDALESSLHYTREYFSERNQKVDPYLAPGLVRYNAKLYLRATGQSAEDYFDLGTMANNGLLLTYGRYRIRILKSDDGDLPAPGPSKAKQAFYHQLPLIFSSGKDDDDPINLVAVWDVTSDYRLREISLVCPKAGNTSRSSVEKHWVWPLAPAGLLDSAPVTANSEGGVPADLPIEYLSEVKTVGEKADG